TIKTKLAAVFTVVVALSGASMFLALQGLGTINESMSNITSGPVHRSIALKDIQYKMMTVASDTRNLILSSEEAELATTRQSLQTLLGDVRSDVDALVGRFGVEQSNIDMKTIADTLVSYDAVLTRVQDEAVKATDSKAFALTTSDGSAAITAVETSLGDLRTTIASR